MYDEWLDKMEHIFDRQWLAVTAVAFGLLGAGATLAAWLLAYGD